MEIFFQWKKKALSLSIHIAMLSAPLSINAAQITATSGQIKNVDIFSWNGASAGIVIQSKDKGSQINVNGTGTFNLSSNLWLFQATDGGSISLTGGGTVNLENARMGIIKSAYSSASDTVGGVFNLNNYRINANLSGMTGSMVALELTNVSSSALSGKHRIENTIVTFQGNGAERARFLHASGVDLTLLNTEVEANNGAGAITMTSMNGVSSNVSIIGGRYYGSNNYNHMVSTDDDLNKRGSTIHVAGSSTLTLSDNAYVGSDDEDNALQLMAANLTIENSTISGGNAGIFSRFGRGNINSSNSLIEGRSGAAVLSISQPGNDILSSTNDVFAGKNGLRIEKYGKINATLNHSLIQVDDAAVSIDRQDALNYSANLNILLQDGSRIEATDAFKVSGSSSILNADLHDSQVNTSRAAALAEGGGQLTLRAYSSSLRGDLLENDDVEDSTLAVVLANGSSLTGASTNVSSIVIQDSTWNITESSSVTKFYNYTGGNVVFVSPTDESLASDYKTLLVNGNYVGGGSIRFNTRLGDDSSLTDRMIVRGDTTNTTQVYVNNTGGSGALTNNGIQLIQVDGQSNGVFSLSNRVVAGMYQYDLFKNESNGGWYLSSAIDPDWVEPTPTPNPSSDTDDDPIPTPSNGSQESTIAPESGVYAHNMTVAAGMFRHTMHDRMGAVHNTYGGQTGDFQPGVWLRTVGSHTDSKGGGGQLNIDTDTTIVQLGGDVAQWTHGGDDRLFVGLMGGYGRSTVHAKNSLRPYTNSGIKNTASGTVEGYHVGAYATWLGNQSTLTGPYVDSWVQYGWFDNSVQGNGSAKESYDSRGLSASVEAGYAFDAGDNETLSWMLEPQAQVIYSRYRADDFRDANDTRISDGKADGFTTRLGARFYSRSKPGKEAIQPFMEVNWWNDSAQGSQRFNGEKLSDGVPKNSYELKGGVQKSIAKGWQVWGHVNGIMGENSYSSYGATLGIKAQF